MSKARNNHEDISPVGPTYSRVVRAGNTLDISGVTAWHSEANGGPTMAQLRVVLERITRIVAADGGKPSDIVALITHVTDMAHFWPIEGEQRAIYEEHFGRDYPGQHLPPGGRAGRAKHGRRADRDRGAELSHRRKSAATSLGHARLRASELGGADGPDQKLQPTP